MWCLSYTGVSFNVLRENSGAGIWTSKLLFSERAFKSLHYSGEVQDRETASFLFFPNVPAKLKITTKCLGGGELALRHVNRDSDSKLSDDVIQNYVIINM